MQRHTDTNEIVVRKRALVSILALCALGAGLSACNSPIWDKDPLAFMSSDPNEKRIKEEEEKKQAALAAAATVPPDIFSNIQPLEMKGGGSLGTMGLNLETYFAGDLKDDQERIKRLERALIAVHEDMKMMAPATQRLADIEVAMKHKVETSVLAPPKPLYAQEQQQAVLPPSPPPMQPAAGSSLQPAPAGDMPGTPVEPGARPMVPAPDGSAIVSGIRVGDHPGMVRIVLDVTSKNTSYTADLDNAEGILVVELPNTRWKTPTDFETFKIMPVLESYKVDTFNNGAGNIFVLQLKSDTQIMAQGKYPALSGGGERIVIDLKK